MEKYTLPDGRIISHLNKIETDFLYKEIFEEKCYLKHGITVSPGDVIFDVGANIGVFTLFMHSFCPDCTIYAFEPIQKIYEVLKSNVNSLSGNITPINYGLSEKSEKVTFVYYPGMTVFSGRFGDREKDKELLNVILHEKYEKSIGDKKLLDKFINSFLAKSFIAEEHVCSLQTISFFIREYGIKKINLLKIDVEKSEFKVLSGIHKQDWPKIDQVVIEIHNPSQKEYDRLTEILVKNRFELTKEVESSFGDVNVYNIYAINKSKTGYDG